MINHFTMKIAPLKQNISFVRSTVSAFCVSVFDSVEEINDIKTAVSEAFTNCVVHSESLQDVILTVEADDDMVRITIEDSGKGIKDVKQAMQPFFTTRTEDERSGMGFTLMKAFMNEVLVTSSEGKGTVVTLVKKTAV